jgi:hypothetical protein
VADQLVALVIDRVDRRDGVLTAAIRDELHFLLGALDHCGAGVGGSEIDADDP